MASITPRKDKSGNIISYTIRVFRGYDSDGKKLKPYTMTYKPEKGMTAKQIDKELNRKAVQFEEQCKLGYALDTRQTFAEYSQYVLQTKSNSGTKHRTIERYKELLERINQGIGHLKLSDIRPQHISQFYTQLRKSEIRKNSSSAFAMPVFSEEIKKTGMLKKDIAAKAQIAYMTFKTALDGKRVSLDSAEAIAKAIGKPIEKLFYVDCDRRPLSEKTVHEHHRLIQMILDQAEKEMLIPYNPAKKIINPPKRGTGKTADYLELSDLELVRDKINEMPLKWQVITHLLLVTGARRGEIMGLKWSAVDLDNRILHIKNNLLYSKEFGIYQDTPKTTGSNRTIPIPEETAELLEEYRNWWIAFRKNCGSAWNMFIELPDGSGNMHREPADFLFIQEGAKLGYPMHPDSPTDYLSKFSKKNNLPHIHPHIFRHTLASVLCLNDMDITTISKFLGHQNVSTTLNVYSHILEKGKERVAACISDTILKKKA